MHPFYEHSAALLARDDSRVLGVVSMAAYLLFWAAAIPVALRMLRHALQPAGRSETDDLAVELVRARYARGEIDRAELLERTEVLRRQTGGVPGRSERR